MTESSVSTPKNKAVWDFIRSRALSLAALVSLTFILMVSTLLNTVSTILVEAVLRMLLATLVATGLFLVGRAVIGIYISSAPQLDIYGAAASLVVLMIWLYYAMQTVLFTACLTAVLNKD